MVRLDVLLVQRGLAETRERAHALILAGSVLLDGTPVTKPSQRIAEDAKLGLADPGPQYVSRGALKLIAALDHWTIDASGCVALDVGASTGGFTDVLLRRGATRVYAVDVGRGQLHYQLRNDPRVVSMEKTNVRFLERLPQQPDLAVADVSFISLRLALPPVFKLLKPRAPVIALIKPQFEAGRGQAKGGVVRDDLVRQRVVDELIAWSQHQPRHIVDVIPSPLRGPAGNVEFLSLWTG